MAHMILLRLPTEEELEEQAITDFDGFYTEFNGNTVAPFTAKVGKKGDGFMLGIYEIHQSDWFNVVD